MYERVKMAELPRRTRKQLHRFELTPEWASMKADLGRGLRKTEALKVSFTPEEMKKYKLANYRTVSRFIQKYVEENELGYKVRGFRRDGVSFVVVTAQ